MYCKIIASILGSFKTFAMVIMHTFLHFANAIKEGYFAQFCNLPKYYFCLGRYIVPTQTGILLVYFKYSPT